MTASIVGRGSYGQFGKDVPSVLDYFKRFQTDAKRQIDSMKTYMAWNIPNPDVSKIMGDVKYNRISSIAKYAITTSCEALMEAELSDLNDSSKIGIFMGTMEGPASSLQKFYKLLKTNGYKKGNPLLFPETSPNVPASYVGIAHQITGPVVTNSAGLTTAYEILEIAMTYLSYGLIDYALVICADEVCDFVSWRLKKAALAEGDSSFISKIDEIPFSAGADCLVLKEGEVSGAKGIIRSVGVTRNKKNENAVTTSVDNVLAKTKLKKEEIDLIIFQNIEENCLRNVFPESPPIIALSSIFGEEFRKCSFLDIIFASLLKENIDIFKQHIRIAFGRNNNNFINSDLHTLLFISLSQTGKCGASIVEVK